jgi:hypothetical protein
MRIVKIGRNVDFMFVVTFFFSVVLKCYVSELGAREFRIFA